MSNIFILKITLGKNCTLLLLIEGHRSQSIASFICMEWDRMYSKEVCSLTICPKMLPSAVLILVAAGKAKGNIALLELRNIRTSVSVLLSRLYNNSYEKRRIQEVYSVGKIDGSLRQSCAFFHLLISSFLCSADT